MTMIRCGTKAIIIVHWYIRNEELNLIRVPGKFLTGEKNNMKWIRNLYNRIRLEIRYRKKLKELRKRDPFIYK